MSIYAGTGHRPPTLGLTYSKEHRTLLEKFAEIELQKLGDCEKIISGLAQGWDQAIIVAARKLKIPYVAAIPFSEHGFNWPIDARELYDEFIINACEVVTVCPGPAANWKYGARDRWMVNHCHKLFALWSGIAKSGTTITVEYATKKVKPIINVWNSWKEYVNGVVGS